MWAGQRSFSKLARKLKLWSAWRDERKESELVESGEKICKAQWDELVYEILLTKASFTPQPHFHPAATFRKAQTGNPSRLAYSVGVVKVGRSYVLGNLELNPSVFYYQTPHVSGSCSPRKSNHPILYNKSSFLQSTWSQRVGKCWASCTSKLIVGNSAYCKHKT